MVSVYLETSVISYLASRPSRDLIIAAHQQITADWWHRRRQELDLFISQVVLNEAGAGDPEAATRRLTYLQGIPVLGVTAEAGALAKRFLSAGLLPAKAADDALHVAIATANGMEFLLTWNCRHIANGEIVRRLRNEAAGAGYDLPTICTPEELLGEAHA
jgi:hypothetical protein